MNFPPNVNALSLDVEIGESIALRNLFSATDLDGDPITQYRFRDNGAANFSGFFTIDGVRQNANQWITVSADDFLRVRYQAGLTTSAESFSIQVFDGQFSNISAAQISTVPENREAPTVIGTDSSVLAGELLPVTDFFTVTDPENNPITRYFFVDRSLNDNGGHFLFQGNRVPSAQFFLVDADQLSELFYVGGEFGPQAENVGVLAFDGKFWSEVTDINIQTLGNNSRPELTVFDLQLQAGRVTDLRSLYSFSDADGNTLSQIGFFDTGIGEQSGFFTINGVRQPAQEWIFVDAADIDNVQYHVAEVASREVYRLIASDGRLFSPVASGISDAIVRPTLAVQDFAVEIDVIQTIDVSQFVSQSDLGTPPTVYQVVDQNVGQNSSRFVLDGTLLGQGRVINLTAAQYERLEIRTSPAGAGRNTDQFLVRSRNPRFWSEWASFDVNVDPVGAESLESNSFFTSPGDTTIITYAFADTLPAIPDYYPLDADERNNPIPFSNPMRDALREVFALYESYANIDFVEVPYNEAGDGYTTLLGTFDIDNEAGVLGFLNPFPGGIAPAGGGDHSLGFNNPFGDIWFDNGDYDPNDPTLDVSRGSEFFATALHEVGHSIGFKHVDAGAPSLPISVSSDLWSVMTSVTDGLGQEPASLLLFDVQQLQNLYGANTDFNTGNTHYHANRNEALREIVWDGGGIDTLNYTNHFVNHTINLNEGQYSSGQQRNPDGSFTQLPNSVLIGYGANIENARGGEGSDTIIGNNGRNLIFANGGNDIIEGEGGNDLLVGGAGDDTYIWRLGDGRDQVRENALGGIDAIEIHDASALDLLQDDLVFRRFGNDLRIDLTFDRDQAQGTILVRDMGLGNSRVETLRLVDGNGELIGEEIDLNSVFTQATTTATRFRVTAQETNFGFIAVPV